MPIRSARSARESPGTACVRRQFELATDPWLGFIFCPAQGPVATHEEALAIDQRLMETVGETPQTLRDLSVSLNRLARIHKAETQASPTGGSSET